MKQVISTDKAPAAVGPYSQAMEAGGFLYLSGMLPIDPATGEMAGRTVEAQTRRIFLNIAALLGEAGATMNDVVKTTVFLTDLGAFSTMNAVYGEAFAGGFPARSCVEVSRLPKDALVEIEAVAYIG